MTSPSFASPWAEAMNGFITFKQAQGYEYEEGAGRLKTFDSFLCTQNVATLLLTRQLFLDYQADLLPHGEAHRYAEFLVARDFAGYYRRIEPGSFAPEKNPFKQPKSARPYIFSTDDVANLMQAAGSLTPTNSIKPQTFTTLIGLLRATGMRISEALNLTTDDIYQQPDRLFIANTKFGKDRCIPIKETTAAKLRTYIKIRRQFVTAARDLPVFINQRGKVLSYRTAQEVFSNLLGQCQIGADWQGASPRLHGLRHTFAVNCLIEAYREGIDPNSRLPYLVTYLGHRDLAATNVYLHTTPELMELTSQRRHDYFFSVQTEANHD